MVSTLSWDAGLGEVSRKFQDLDSYDYSQTLPIVSGQVTEARR